MRSTLKAHLFILAIWLGGTALASAQQKEFIICSGGPALRQWEDLRQTGQQHDRWWGNFVRTARVRMQEIQKTEEFEQKRAKTAKSKTIWRYFLFGSIRSKNPAMVFL